MHHCPGIPRKTGGFPFVASHFTGGNLIGREGDGKILPMLTVAGGGQHRLSGSGMLSHWVAQILDVILSMKEANVRGVLIGIAGTVIPLGMAGVGSGHLVALNTFSRRNLPMHIITVGMNFPYILRKFYIFHCESPFPKLQIHGISRAQLPRFF